MNNADNISKPYMADKLAVAIALLYIILLAAPISLPCNIKICDFLAIAMLVCLSVKIRAELSPQNTNPTHLNVSVFPPTLLTAYLATALLATALHLHCTFSEYYEWLVFAFVAFLYHFYTNVSISRKTLAIFGTAILLAVLLAFAYELIASISGMQSHFCFISEQMEATEMAFLSRRFSFTFQNPNSFACYYMLLFAMLMPFVQQHEWTRHSLALRLLYFPLCLLLLLPLLSSASKHGLMSLAILASWMKPIFAIDKKWLSRSLLAGVLLVAVVFETTVLHTTFPLKSSFPFINTEPGMYSVHQGTYARMFKAHPVAYPFGMGITKAMEEYPKFVDKIQAKSILERYNAMASYENFITFLDAHNEFLNQLVLFGVIPLLILLLFLLREANGKKGNNILFITALLCCCLWGDLLSKRPVWIALAIMSNFGNIAGQSKQKD